jgi:hypothetical protein
MASDVQTAKTGTPRSRKAGWVALILLFAIAVLFAAWDVIDYASGSPWKSTQLGQRWFWLHKDSLLLIQPAIERHIAAWLWPPFQWVLQQPAWLLPVVGGAMVLLFKIIRRRA